MFCVLGCISLDVSSKFEAGKDGIWEDDNGLAQFSSMRALRMSFFACTVHGAALSSLHIVLIVEDVAS